MNATIILTCVLFLFSVFATYYRQQPYGAKQFVNGIGKVYFFFSGTVLSAFALVLLGLAIYNNAPVKIHGFSLALLAFGFYIAYSSFKK